jgi:hypothetical protein
VIYVGFKANEKPEVFESDIKPSKETYPQYDFVHGPFESVDKAQKYVSAFGSLACGDG